MQNYVYFSITAQGVQYLEREKPSRKVKKFCEEIHKGFTFFNQYAPPNTSKLVCVSGDNYSSICRITTADKRQKETRIIDFSKSDISHVLSLMVLHSWNITAPQVPATFLPQLSLLQNATETAEENATETASTKAAFPPQDI